MKKYNLIMGSHVSMSSPGYYLRAVEISIENDANALMIYTGAPQNTKRAPLDKMKINEGLALIKKENLHTKNVIVHAPYIINLANGNPEKRRFAIDFLKKEYKRVDALGSKIMVLHPGNHLKETKEKAMDWIVEGLNEILDPKIGVSIALETMAGKGTEIGKTFEELKYIIDKIEHQDLIGVCIDTCHVFDAGYDIVNDLEGVIDRFDQIIGLEKNLVMHINDSKNPCGSRKDRHENIGYGNIGFESLAKIVWHPKFNNIAKILETPFANKISPYKSEIEILKNKKFKDFRKDL